MATNGATRCTSETVPEKFLDPVDTDHMTYGEAHAAALAISTQNDLVCRRPRPNPIRGTSKR